MPMRVRDEFKSTVLRAPSSDKTLPPEKGNHARLRQNIRHAHAPVVTGQKP